MALAREEGRRSAGAVRVKANGSVRDGRENGRASTRDGMRCDGERNGKENIAQINKRISEGGRAAKEGKDENERACTERVNG